MERPIQEPSFEHIAAELSLPLLRHLRRRAGDHAVADDLLQETLVRMAQGLSGFAGRASLKTWAFAIANRVAADYLRSPERRLHTVGVDEAAQLADAGCAVDAQLEVGEMTSCMREMIEDLPEAYRAALVLHDIEDCSARQIAETGNCSLATAKIRIHRARNQLKAALQQECRFYRDGDEVLRCERKPQD